MASIWKNIAEENRSQGDLSNNPSIETNKESHNNKASEALISKNQDLEEEQFHSNKVVCLNNTQKSINIYGTSAGKVETVRDATMTLYNSINASDHI